MPTNSEDIVSSINSSIFFKEFTFSKTDFKALNSKQMLELADNGVWLDDLFFIFQIKERDSNSAEYESWFQNKVLNKGVKQIKSTLKYLSTYPEIYVTNEKGHRLSVAAANNNLNNQKLIIYSADVGLPSELREKKFYRSTDVGLIHLFYYEDYYWICKTLITPVEVNEYLNFRMEFFNFNEVICNSLPEQYFLAHFLKTPSPDHFDPSYIGGLASFQVDVSAFDISMLMENFAKNIKMINYQTEYYPIIKEIAKLNRVELAEFKKRFSYTLDNRSSKELIIPYRMHVPRTDCAFVFIPLQKGRENSWRNALENFTMLNKYSNKAGKGIGCIAFTDPSTANFFELYWLYTEEPWEYNEEIEKHLVGSPPLREVKTKIVENRY